MSSFTHISVLFGESFFKPDLANIKRIAQVHLNKLPPQAEHSPNRKEELTRWFLQYIVDLTDQQVYGFAQHGHGTIQWSVKSRWCDDAQMYLEPLTPFFIEWLSLDPYDEGQEGQNILIMAQWQDAKYVEVIEFNYRSIVRPEGALPYFAIRKGHIPFSFEENLP